MQPQGQRGRRQELRQGQQQEPQLERQLGPQQELQEPQQRSDWASGTLIIWFQNQVYIAQLCLA